MKILFTGGGTGGHIIPIIALTREIRRVYQSPDLQFHFLGPKDDFSQALLSQEGIKVKYVLAGKIRRYPGWKNFLWNVLDVCVKIPLGTLQAFFYIFFMSPDLIFSKGGFGSIPGVLAGRLLFVPTILHESDITPGAANKFLSNLVMEIFVSFPKTEYFPIKKMILVGNPTRREILEGSKEEAKTFFKMTSPKPVLLILGGSQGAQRINDKILEVLPQLLENFEIIHQCGDNNFQQVKAESKVLINQEQEKFYHLFPFLREPEMKRSYAAADLICSRAGSGSIFEIAAVGKPSILIPLPESAQNHQVKNAYAYQESGSCIVIEETNFTSHFFLERIKSLFTQTDELLKMTKSTNSFAKPQAAKIIANYLVEYLTRGK